MHQPHRWCLFLGSGAFVRAGRLFHSPPGPPPFSLPLLMDEGFEVLTAAGICVGKRGDIQRIIKRKNQLALKKK